MADIKPGRLSSEELSDNFSDLHAPMTQHEAFVEADRCYFCYDAPCMTACPTNIDIPMFIRQIAADNPNGSAHTILKSNIMGGMCARVCPTETLCEQVCVRETAEGKPVKIGQLQRYATDYLMENSSDHPFERAEETGKKIAVVGAGPAGLSCAHRLSMYGHSVTVLEAKEKSGGLNEYGIAAYKSTDAFATKEVEFILDIGGITIRNGNSLGDDITIEDLTADYDAVFLGVGLPNVNGLGLEGDETDGCIDAVDYISELRQADDLSTLEVGRNVVVIGGGMTAIDVATQAKLLGAESVTIFYRRGAESMNASRYEQEVAQTNGVTIRHWLQPHSLNVEDGSITSITMEYTSDINGSLSGTGETITVNADQVFKAIKTDNPKIWAGGDCIAGGEDLTVVSVEDGKLAAEDIHKALSK